MVNSSATELGGFASVRSRVGGRLTEGWVGPKPCLDLLGSAMVDVSAGKVSASPQHLESALQDLAALGDREPGHIGDAHPESVGQRCRLAERGAAIGMLDDRPDAEAELVNLPPTNLTVTVRLRSHGVHCLRGRLQVDARVLLPVRLDGPHSVQSAAHAWERTCHLRQRG